MSILAMNIAGQVHTPSVANGTWIAPDAWVIGACTLGEQCTVMFGAVIRGDVLPITVGARTNIQDGVVVHTSTGLTSVVIGTGVTVGHRAIIHGAHIGDDCLIGMGAIILDGAQIGAGSIVGAHALVTKGVKIPPRSLVLGSPAKVIRPITDAEFQESLVGAAHYVKKGVEYQSLTRSHLAP